MTMIIGIATEDGDLLCVRVHRAEADVCRRGWRSAEPSRNRLRPITMDHASRLS